MASVTYDEFLSQLKDKLDIVEIVSRDVILKKSGAIYWGLCPFHKEKTPSFSVTPSKGIFKCFGCGEGGDALTYLLKTRGLEFKDLIKELAEEYGLELPNTFAKAPSKGTKEQMIKACKMAAEFYQHNIFSSSEAKNALDYLHKRDIDESIIKTYSLGFAPKNSNSLFNELKKNFPEEILEKSGLILKSNQGGYIDRFKNRITIPIHDENGNITAFGARAIEEGQNPKYLNSSDSLIYNKSKILYGLHFAKDAIKELDSVIIMEGYFDVISSQAHGVKNCVASCGTSLTTDHIKILSRYTRSRKIYLSFDTDSAGIKATQRGGALIKEAFTGLGNIKQFDESYTGSTDEKYACEIRVITPPEGKDPDEFVRTVGAQQYLKYVEHAPLLLDFQLNQIIKRKNEISTPVEKAQLVNEIIAILAEIENKIIRSEYVKMVAATLNTDEKAINAELDKKCDLDGFAKPNINTIVTKTSNIEEKAQKNLLSIFMVAEAPLSTREIYEMLKNVTLSDEKLTIVKDTIDKIACSVNNVKALIEKLYIIFAQDEEKKAIITDLICISEAFNNLTKKDFLTLIDESIKGVGRFRIEKERNEMRNLYKNVNDNDNEALKVQMQLRDKIKKRK